MAAKIYQNVSKIHAQRRHSSVRKHHMGLNHDHWKHQAEIWTQTCEYRKSWKSTKRSTIIADLSPTRALPNQNLRSWGLAWIKLWCRWKFWRKDFAILWSNLKSMVRRRVAMAQKSWSWFGSFCSLSEKNVVVVGRSRANRIYSYMESIEIRFAISWWQQQNLVSARVHQVPLSFMRHSFDVSQHYLL